MTGYPQMDPLFRTQTGRTPAKPPGVPSSRTVLFAPTYNPILSGAYALQDDVSRLIRRDDTGIRVLIRPHPHLLRDAPFIIDKWCQQARTSPNIEMVTDPALNIMDMFDQCDLMISDVSSVALAWFAVDRPLVCVVDPDRAGSSPRYAPDGLEWQMLKAAHVVQDPETLAPLVHALLERPDPGAKTRSEFANFLFGNLRDGNAAGRIADRITTHLREAPR